MVPDDLFATDDGPFGGRPQLDTDLLRRLRDGPPQGESDLEAALALVGLLRAEYVAYGTDGGNALTDAEVRDLQRTTRSVLSRLGIALEVPWRDFSGFRSYWVSGGGYGSWQARRDMVAEVFDSVQDALEEIEHGTRHDLVTSVTSHEALGWPRVDREIQQLRRAFQRARSPLECREVGLACVGVLEAVSEAAYDPAKHLYAGEEIPPVAKTKQRLTRVAEHAVGSEGPSAELSKLIRAAIELGEAVKHSPHRTRAEAGIAADAVFLVANMLRRLTLTQDA